jgi:hypothetical protein
MSAIPLMLLLILSLIYLDLHRRIVLLIFSSSIGSSIIGHSNCTRDLPSFFPIYLSVLAIVKNEAAYVAEWLEFHLLVGVDRFWLVNNESTDNITSVLSPYIALGIVQLSSWNGRGIEFSVYNHYLPTLRKVSYWLALIDLDEFRVPVDGRSVAYILQRFEGSACVTLNWVTYGANGQLNKTAGLVIERFPNHTERRTWRNKHVKQIVNSRCVKRLFIHEHDFTPNSVCRDPIGETYHKGQMFNREPVHEVLRINHYWSALPWRCK